MNNGGGGSSECSSGCESGWTVYLEKSWLSPSCSISQNGVRSGKMGKEEEEEDMSMVSDASSAPPHFIDSSVFNNHACFYPPGGAAETGVADATAALMRSIRGRKQRNRDVKKQRMLLDDTASSRPVSHHFKKNELGLRNKNQSLMESHHSMLDLSHGFSTTCIQNGPSAMDLFGHQYHQTQFLGGNWMGFK